MNLKQIRNARNHPFEINANDRWIVRLDVQIFGAKKKSLHSLPNTFTFLGFELVFQAAKQHLHQDFYAVSPPELVIDLPPAISC